MEIIFRSILIFVILFILLKFQGKKQIQHLTLYDYVIGITIGSIAGDTIVSLDYPLIDGVISLVVFALIGYLVSFLTFHSRETEEFLDGEPLVLFENDEFISENLKKAKLTPSKILESCRIKGCFDISDLDCAILETSGDISVLLKSNSQNISKSDLKETVKKNSKKQTLCYEVITNGELNEDELKKAKKTKKWLNNYLKSQNKKIEDVFLLSIDKYGKATIYPKKEKR